MKHKNFIFVLLTILTCFCLVGCGNKKVFKISLDDGGSSSYEWSYNVDKDDIIDISESHDNSGCSPETNGCVGKNIYTVTALKPGKTTLTLEFSSFLEPEDIPLEIAIYEITVNDDLSITETHYGTYFDED